jgi:signal transduction histidine kinase
MSLRLRVTLVAVLAVAVGLAAAATLLVLSLRAGLINGLDDAAQARATTAAGAVDRGDLPAAVSTVGVDSLVQVLARDGAVLASSPGLGADRALVALPVGAGARQQPDISIAERDARVLTLTASGGRVVVVVTPLADVQESGAQLVRRLLLGGPVLLALICAAVWVLAGYTLRTVERLREQVAQLSVAGLADRVELPAARDEVRQLAVTMNDLLDRLQAAATAQRRFVADAAHELRSPLAALHARLEVGERAGDRVAPVLIRDAERLGQLIDDLLALARLDESPRLLRPVPVDLDDIVLTEVARLRGAAVVLDTREVAPALMSGDPDLLRRIVGNLLSNAVRHAVHRVRVSVSTSDGQVELVVADDGPGIPVAERDRVFRRFHRLDDARTRDGGGSGLGLAIVRDAVRAHRGTVIVQDDRPGAVLTVWLPRDPG